MKLFLITKTFLIIVLRVFGLYLAFLSLTHPSDTNQMIWGTTLGIFSILLSFLLQKYLVEKDRAQPQPTLTSAESIEKLKQYVMRKAINGTWLLFVFGMFIILSVCVGLYITFQSNQQGGVVGMWPLFIWLLIGIGALILAKKSYNNYKHPKIIDILKDPSRIVWIYVLNANAYGVRIAQNIVIGTMDGKKSEAPCPPDFLNSIWKTIVESAPQATAGYSLEYQKKFKENPQLLKK